MVRTGHVSPQGVGWKCMVAGGQGTGCTMPPRTALYSRAHLHLLSRFNLWPSCAVLNFLVSMPPPPMPWKEFVRLYWFITALKEQRCFFILFYFLFFIKTRSSICYILSLICKQPLPLSVPLIKICLPQCQNVQVT